MMSFEEQKLKLEAASWQPDRQTIFVLLTKIEMLVNDVREWEVVTIINGKM